MKIKLTIILVFLIQPLIFAQVKGIGTNIWYAKEFSKDIALFNSKAYLFKNILGSSSEVVKFEVIPLAAASSGELTTLLYRCEAKQKEGLILGFYGNYSTDAGVVYTGFAFKNFEKEQAIEFLDKIQNAVVEFQHYLNDDTDNNNIFFKYDDVEVLICAPMRETYTIRLFWSGFDATWEKTAFNRSKRRFERKLK